MSVPDEGLGLEYGVLRLVRVPHSWSAIGTEMAERVAQVLEPHVVAVEHIGSTSVPDLVAKPILDLAVGVAPDVDLDAIERSLVDAGWIYRGDAGDSGGRVFVLEREPWVRVAHIHVVDFDGSQWRRYLDFRDRLRTDPAARRSYEDVKQSLLAELGPEDSRKEYTDGKTRIVRSLDGSGPEGDD